MNVLRVSCLTSSSKHVWFCTLFDAGERLLQCIQCDCLLVWRLLQLPSRSSPFQLVIQQMRRISW